jgi:hypothetical protein
METIQNDSIIYTNTYVLFTTEPTAIQSSKLKKKMKLKEAMQGLPKKSK